MNPVWKETLEFEIHKPTDYVIIQIANNSGSGKEVLAQKQFVIGEVNQNSDEPLNELNTQRRIEDVLCISSQDDVRIGEIKYQANWIYNKQVFLEQLLKSMKAERDDLIVEIKHMDQKMQLICKPFGGYKNILNIDDLYFEDDMMPGQVKEYLQVTEREKRISVKFNLMANAMGLKDTRWGRATIILFVIWTLCTSWICFEKPDFLNVSNLNF